MLETVVENNRLAGLKECKTQNNHQHVFADSCDEDWVVRPVGRGGNSCKEKDEVTNKSRGGWIA